MKKKQTIILTISVSFLIGIGCTRTANRTGPLTPYPAVTSDIAIGEAVSGEGTRAELLGFIRWGDTGRASFTARDQETDLGGGVVKQSMQSAVYDALGGQPDNFILDPHFHTVEHNFLIFRTAKTKVMGRKARHENYRQVKKFNTDDTNTLPLDEAPQSYTVRRNGREATKIISSGNITPFVADTAKVYDTSSGVRILDMDIPQDSGNGNASLEALETKLNELNRRIDALK